MDQDLLNLGPGGIGLFTDAGNVDRHLPPAINRIAGIEDFGFHNLAAAFLRAQIGFWQKDLPHRNAPGAEPITTAFHDGGKEILRDFNMDARTIAGLAIGIHRAAMPNGAQRINAGLHNLSPWLAIQRGNKANTAGIMFGQVKMRFTRQARGFGAHKGDVLFAIVHHRHSAATAMLAWPASMKAAICSATSRPSRMPHTTSDAPRTISPAAKTPGSAVIMLR